MMFLEIANVLTLQIAGSITGLFAAAVAGILGIITSILIVNGKKLVNGSWSRSSSSQPW